MKTLIIAAMAAVSLTAATNGAFAHRTDHARHAEARDFYALSAQPPLPSSIGVVNDGALHGPSGSSDTSATGGPAGGIN